MTCPRCGASAVVRGECLACGRVLSEPGPRLATGRDDLDAKANRHAEGYVLRPDQQGQDRRPYFREYGRRPEVRERKNRQARERRAARSPAVRADALAIQRAKRRAERAKETPYQRERRLARRRERYAEDDELRERTKAAARAYRARKRNAVD